MIKKGEKDFLPINKTDCVDCLKYLKHLTSTYSIERYYD